MPATRVAMTMNWRDLLFLHYPCEPESIQRLLPPGLTVDTYPDESGSEMAWVGLVPFRMESVRPKGVPRIKACENFLETNVRTYCHVDQKDPGVWFFSLDAANPVACAVARSWFHLNYHHAEMTDERHGDNLTFESTRKWGSRVNSRASCRVGVELGPAKPGTLDFFLVERYLLYSIKGGRLFRGQVFHPPYNLCRVEEFRASGGLLDVNGLDDNEFRRAVFSPGVDVSAGRIVAVQ
jgi:uncharacterized protein YqjF (DUF2071 family)